MKQLFIFLLTINTFWHCAQNKNVPLNEYGRWYFSMGSFPEKLYMTSINIQLDSNFYHNYKHLPHITIADPYIGAQTKYTGNEYTHIQLEFGELGKPEIGEHRYPQHKNLEASALCWDRKFAFNRMLAVGQVHLTSGHARKIKWLDMDIKSGRITDFSNYQKLQVVHLYNQHFNRLYEADWARSLFSGVRLHYYPGDPFLWKSLLQVPLQGLLIDQDADPFHKGSSGNICFLDESISGLIGNGKLKSLHVKDIPYFPVNFKDFESLEHLHINSLLAPELTNLAAIMHSFNKDRSGNWSMYFESFDTSAVINIPANGIYTSRYQNGKLLCRGNYIQDKPDGTWEFWYENGQLCEERHYNNGQKEGNWTFYNPNGDTIILFQYLNNLLTYRKDIHFDEISTCYSYEISMNVKTTIEHHLDWKGENEVQIEKKLYSIVLPTPQQWYKIGDKLSGFREKWNFSNGEWEYWSSDFCLDQEEFDTLHLKGWLGETPYLSEGKSIYIEQNPIYKENLLHQERHWVIDYQNCYWEYHQYSNSNKEKMYRLEKTDRQNIPVTKGFCK